MGHPSVLVTSRAPDPVIRALEEYAHVILGDDPARGMPRDEVLSRVGDAHAIINQNELRIDEELLLLAPGLKIVANTAAGFDNMDIEAMRRRRIWGTNCPLSYAADTATHTIALLLALAKRLLEADAYVRSGRWKNEGWMPGGRWDGMSLSGKSMGLIGYGHIGREVARRAEAFGMSVHYFTRSGAGAPQWRPFDEIIRTSDVISLHCPLTPQTRHLIDAEAFSAMKPSAILLNVSRGPVVKTDDLLAALQDGKLAGAGLDVFEFEPEVPVELASMQNVVLSPHMGGCTVEARNDAWEVCVGNVLSVLQGGVPRTPAFPLDLRSTA